MRIGTLAAILILVAPVTAPAQSGAKSPRVGFAEPGGAECKLTARAVGLLDGLREAGRDVGRDISVDHKCYANDSEMRKVLRGFVSGKVAAIIVSAPLPALVARDLTRQIPIVCASCGDPLDNGLVRDMSRPGGNLTGFASLSAELIGKRVQLLKASLPGVARIAAVINPDNPGTRPTLKALEDAGGTLGIAIERVEFRSIADVDGALKSAVANGAGAVLLQDDPYVFASRKHIATVALKLRLPASAGIIEFADEGGMMAYGPDRVDLHRRSGHYVDRILKGAKPGDLPFEQPSKFDFVVNLKTARAIGLALPESLLLQATRVIE